MNRSNFEVVSNKYLINTAVNSAFMKDFPRPYMSNEKIAKH